MKFYYNGQLIRTSKNHIYTHAIIDITDKAYLMNEHNKKEQCFGDLRVIDITR